MYVCMYVSIYSPSWIAIVSCAIFHTGIYYYNFANYKFTKKQKQTLSLGRSKHNTSNFTPLAIHIYIYIYI